LQLALADMQVLQSRTTKSATVVYDDDYYHKNRMHKLTRPKVAVRQPSRARLLRVYYSTISNVLHLKQELRCAALMADKTQSS